MEIERPLHSCEGVWQEMFFPYNTYKEIWWLFTLKNSVPILFLEYHPWYLPVFGYGFLPGSQHGQIITTLPVMCDDACESNPLRVVDSLQS